MVAESLRRDSLRTRASSVSDRTVLALVAAAIPVPLAIGLGVAYGQLAGLEADQFGTVANNVSYGIASLAVVATVWGLLSETERDAAFRFERPGRAELGWTAVCFPVGVFLFVTATEIAAAFGAEMGGFGYTLEDPVTVAAVVFGGVLVAPFVEEVLFRGFLLGSLLGRGVSPVVAGVVTVVAFGAIHLPLLGVAGVFATTVWAILPTVLRLRFDNLSGAWLLHFVNNVWANVGVVALGFA
ncbi:CPBP family intramembrane glutamic endopeptidase [Halorussus salinisoli]|uniref:CPBP family intramembrane glutamic endopeptidase n=1 Tax=Halorussus salinisoli TaxID=2558242 RepID=UPI0010C1B3A5|nr:CPBP family intramembrane glutamic endopeptidase [Halorussus salinisoli]